MNKGQLVASISLGAKISKADARRALVATVESIERTLKKGERVALIGFGSFSIVKRVARTGRNPRSGKEIKIAAKRVVKFRAGTDFLKRLNK